MSTNDTRDGENPTSLWRVVQSILRADLPELLTLLPELVKRLSSLRVSQGMYEVLEYEAQLELLDPKGKKALYSKREKVRFLQDHIIAYQDQAWGDGNIFADYKCSPGVAVDRYREGHRYRVLISLRETKNRGDIEEFHVERTITDGFTKAIEELQTEVDHPTRKLSVSIVLPKGRWVKQVTLIEQNTARTTDLGAECTFPLPDGRQQVRWEISRPRLHEAYILRWQW